MNYPDSNGYNRVRPPLFRELDVLLVGVGAIVAFRDRGGREDIDGDR